MISGGKGAIKVELQQPGVGTKMIRAFGRLSRPFVLCALGLLVACGEPENAAPPLVTTAQPAPDPAEVAALPATPPPSPNWEEVEDGTYFYIAGLSEPAE